MKPFLLFLIVIIAFGLSFSKHLSIIMYPLSVVIFYFYLPILYSSSRINSLHHLKESEVFHIKFYPMELGFWFLCTCFFSYVLTHLISDLLYSYREELYHFTFFLVAVGLAGTIYCELDAKKLHRLSRQSIYKVQGKFLAFELLFIMLLFFEMNP